MSSLKPRNRCWIKRRTRVYDQYGREEVSVKSTPAKCSIVSLYDAVEPTAVRHDSAASQARIEERVASMRVLLLPRADVRTADIIEVEIRGSDNISFEVNRVFRRPDISGKIQHIDVEGDLWVSD